MRLKEIALCFALCSALCFAVLLSLGAVAHAQNGAFSQASASASSGVALPSGEYDASALETGASYQSSMSFYSEFYSTTGTPIVGGIVSNPSSIDLVGRTPTSVYLAPGRVVSYAQYSSSTAATRSGELWISGSTDWSRYVACPVGTWLQLVAYSPASGAADFYEIIGNTQLQYTQYRFSSGYNTMSYQADQVGRHVLLFVSSNQSSNAIIVDVFAASSQPSSQPASQPSSQPSSQPPYTQTTQVQTPTQTQTQVPTQIPTQTQVQTQVQTPTPVTTSGDTPVTIVSQGMRGYQVYLDGTYIGTEGTGGDVLDGRFSFAVAGNQEHNVRVYDGQFNYPKTMFFERGVQKIIYVEPGTAVYI